MNVLKKIYSRIYQRAFRLVLPVLPYRNPYVLHDLNALDVILLKKENLKKVLIVTDKGIVENKIINYVYEALEGKVASVLYDKTDANPSPLNVKEALSLYKDNNCEGIIAIGGGSSLDCAKAVGACVVYPNKDLSKMKGILKVHKKLPPFIAIPTTAGTGSETTLASVITNKETNDKYAIMSFPLIPKYAILDAKLTYTLPKHLTSTTGLDALTHAIEAYIGKSTIKETRCLSLEACKLIFENIVIAYKEPLNFEARKNMLDASFKAGLAFSKSYVGYIHAVAHSLGGKYNTPHGLANAVIMPYVLKMYGKSIYKKLYKIGLYTNICNKDDSYAVGANKVIEKIISLNNTMNIPDKLDVIKDEDIDSLVLHAYKEANPLYPVPKLFSLDEMKEIYYQIKK